MRVLVQLGFALCCGLTIASLCHAEETLFSDNFEGRLSNRWKPVGLEPDDYRVRDGALELRLQPTTSSGRTPMLEVDLPFKSSDTVTASVEVSVVGEPLRRGEFAGLSFIDEDGESFNVKKTNIDGYLLFAPGFPEFMGKPGEEGDPNRYTVKYWPADPEAGPLSIIIRHHYAYFRVGPSREGAYRTFYHSAITQADRDLGFGLMAGGSGTGSDNTERWIRFDNFRVWKP